MWNKSQAEVKVKPQFITDVKTKKTKEISIPAGRMKGYYRFISHRDLKLHYKEKDFIVNVK